MTQSHALRALFGFCLFALSACGNNQLEQEIQALKNGLDETTQLLRQLEAQHQQPTYQFTLFNVQHRIQEKMFQPILASSAELQVEGELIPSSLYLDVELTLVLPENEKPLVSRQVFYVKEGQAKLEMIQVLPEHGLQLENIAVSLMPLNWYKGHIIAADQVEVDQNPR